MRLWALILAVALAACSPSGYRDTGVAMQAVAVDVDRYMGQWFEIARFPNRFEEGCAGVTATYERLSRQRVSVVNTCRDGGLDGPEKQVKGRARVVGPGQLTVSFLPDAISMFDGLAAGDYWVLWISEDYGAAVVGEPSGRTGWILGRDTVLDDETRAAALEALAKAGYATDSLHWTDQPQTTE